MIFGVFFIGTRRTYKNAVQHIINEMHNVVSSKNCKNFGIFKCNIIAFHELILSYIIVFRDILNVFHYR